jgi:large subunit ribosomal protein L31
VKQGIHPNYGFVVFKDASSDFAALTRSTKKSDKTIKWHDGE